MRKQTKLVAVLSTAALLAIGASMTSFAATGWAEEDGTWVYYDRNGDRVTDKWAKSGNNWYWLDEDGEMAVDQLIEDGDNYYYVDINGVMAANQWVAIENEDAGEDNEPDHYWYYFQANGKALTNGNNSSVALKTVNGKKYAFDEEGKMLYGWVSKDTAERIDNTDGDAFKTGDYYFGTEDDGAMTVGWLQMDVTYDEAVSDDVIAPVFNEDEDQTRWFYFQSNGKKVAADESKGDVQKGKTINGRKYEFDKYGAMTAEWSLDIEKASKDAPGATPGEGKNAKYSQAWRYFNSVEDGARVSKGWFKVVAAEALDASRYNDDEDAWYYADGSGNLYAGQFKTIKGKKYAFRNDGRMIDGLKFILADEKNDDLTVPGSDDADYPYDTESGFLESSKWYNANGYYCYYFGDGEDGAMRTNKNTVTIDGDSFNFYFEKSGSHKGAGVTGEKDDKFYQAGMLLKSGSDEKYQVVQKISDKVGFDKLDDAQEFIKLLNAKSEVSEENLKKANALGTSFNKKLNDLSELYVIDYTNTLKAEDFRLVNTSGKIIDSKSKSKDGNDYVYVTDRDGNIRIIYVED